MLKGRWPCPGCLNKIEDLDEVCCNECWRRTPFYIKAKFNVAHTRRNWDKYLKAKIKLIDWLKAHYDPHFESKAYPS